MTKYLCVLFPLIFSCCIVNGRSLSGPQTVRNYSPRQKRLLIHNTAQFINILTQSSLDQDSVILMACGITGLPILTAYNENFVNNEESAGASLINSGKIAEAILILNSLKTEQKIPLLLELGIWYLHQPNAHKKDLANAKHYILEATALSNKQYSAWKNAAIDMLSEYYFQNGEVVKATNGLMEVISSSLEMKNDKASANACQHLGKLLPFSDSMKLSYYNKSLELFNRLQLKEKQIELLWNIVLYGLKYDPKLMENNLRQILSMQQSIGFQHTLFSQFILSYTLLLQGKSIEGLEYAKNAEVNLKWSGMNAFSSSFTRGIGQAYVTLEKYDEALIWYKKGLVNLSVESQLFWFKSLVNAVYILNDMYRYQEALSLIDSISAKFPPITRYQKIMVFILSGYCNEHLLRFSLADKNYSAALELAKNSPEMDREFSQEYQRIASFYVNNGDLKKGRLFFKKGLSSPRTDLYAHFYKYSILYKIDSADGNYKAALQDHIQYKIYHDSLSNTEVKTKLDELTMKFGAEKKDQDIKLLKQLGIAQQSELMKNKIIRNIVFAGAVMLLLFLGLLYNRFRLKQKTNKQLESQQNEIAQKNTSLQNLVEQKEWLLKEVHHRVKNNLQIIISLLNIQSNYLDSDAAVKAIRESQERMNAISLIHHKLYKSEDSAFINIKEYVHELVEHIRNGLSGSSRIVFDLNISDTKMDVAQAVPLGLILNEAISNAVKYAFPSQTSGRVNISFTHSSVDDHYLLTVADNGVSLPPDYDISKKSSFGIRLMQGLSKQLGGSFKIDSDNGVKIRVTFKCSKIIELFEKKEIKENVA